MASLAERVAAFAQATAADVKAILLRTPPAAGTTGHILTKTAGGNAWSAANTTGRMPTGGVVGAILKKTTAADYAASWQLVGELPVGGTAGQVLKKSSATNYAAVWSTAAEVPAGGVAGQSLVKTSATDFAVSWATLIGLPSGGAPGQIPVRTSGGYAWADAPPGLGTFAVPSGGDAGMHLVKLSATDGDVGWDAPTGGGGSAGEVMEKITRGFISNVVSSTPDALNMKGIGYTIRMEGGNSVVSYDAVKSDSFTTPASSIPNLTMLKSTTAAGWQSIHIFLGSQKDYNYPGYLKKSQSGSWRGVARFTLENDPDYFGNFFAGVILGSTAMEGALRGWRNINGTQFSYGAMAGIGFEFADTKVQFVWSFNDVAGTQKIATTLDRTALVSQIHEARFVLTEDRLYLSATIVHIPSNVVVAGPELLPLTNVMSFGYTMSIGRGTDSSNRDYVAKFVGVAKLTMETDY